MSIIERNELYDADGRVYRIESYEVEFTSRGAEISGEFRGPVPGTKAPELPANHGAGCGASESFSGSVEFRMPDEQAQKLEDLIVRAIFESKVERIITNGRSTIVCWKDGTKTRVALSAGEDTDGSVYEGFLWACVKKAFGSHRRFERLVDSVHVDQDEQRRERARMKSDSRYREYMRKHPNDKPMPF